MFKRDIYRSYLWGTAIALLALPACRKDQRTFETYTNGQQEIEYLLRFVPSPATTSVFILQGAALSQDTVLTTAGGVRLYIQNNDQLFVTETGIPQPCSECISVRIEVTEVQTLGDWLSRGLPSTDADGQLLRHSGSVGIRVSCDTKSLDIAADRYIKVQIPAPLTPDAYQINYARTDADNNLTHWEKGGDNSTFVAQWPATPPAAPYNGYELLTDQLGWVSAAAPLAGTDFSDIKAQLPQQFDEANTRVFAVFEEQGIVVALQPDPGTGLFVLTGAPNGVPVRLITISKTGPQYWLSDTTTTTADDAITIRPKPATSSNQAILTLLSGL